MKRYGYTIAETIITMAIIGIVAAITIPSFISSYRKTTYSNALAAAVVNFDTAMSTMMMKEIKDDLLDTEAWRALDPNNTGTYSLSQSTNGGTIQDFMDIISRTLPLTSFSTDSHYYSQLSDPGAVPDREVGEPVRFFTRNGVEYLIFIDGVSKATRMREAEAAGQGSNYLNKAGDVFIDINGDNEPNVQGRDWFRFELGTDGHLYPYGGRDHTVYDDSIDYNPTTNCVTNQDGHYCAAYLMENGYRMDY